MDELIDIAMVLSSMSNTENEFTFGLKFLMLLNRLINVIKGISIRRGAVRDTDEFYSLI